MRVQAQNSTLQESVQRAPLYARVCVSLSGCASAFPLLAERLDSGVPTEGGLCHQKPIKSHKIANRGGKSLQGSRISQWKWPIFDFRCRPLDLIADAPLRGEAAVFTQTMCVSLSVCVSLCVFSYVPPASNRKTLRVARGNRRLAVRPCVPCAHACLCACVFSARCLSLCSS